jgi:L-fucose isomerase-like protein
MELPAMKAAFVGFGEVNTPRELVEKLCASARERLERAGITLLATEPVSDDPEGRDVARACDQLEGQAFDFLVICLAGWIPSHAVIAVADRFRHKPMLLWGLTGWQEGGRLVTTAAQAGTTAVRKTMADMGYRFKYVIDYMGQPSDEREILDFARAARAAARLRGARVGMMGFRDMNLYATLHDGVSLRADIGPEVEVFEMLEIAQRIEALAAAEVQDLVAAVKSRWTFETPAEDETVAQAVRLFLAVQQKVRERGYAAVSLIDVDGVKKLMGFPPAAAFMLLHEETGVCTIPENDALGAVTQLMQHYVTGQAAAYLEFYEFSERTLLMGVPDYVPTEVVDGPVTVRPTAFGQLGVGLLNTSRMKTGPVTLCRLFRTGDCYGLHLVTGEAQAPRPWEEAGWAPPAPQLPSLEITLDGSVPDFVQAVMGQHYILTYGDNTAGLKDLCDLLDVEVV